MSELPAQRISRRRTLQWVAACSALSGIGRLAVAGDARLLPAAATARGYGTDPDLKSPVVPWERIMGPQQLQLAGALADVILPGTAGSPAPSVLGIADFVDEWVSAPYPEQQSDRGLILGGLEWLDAQSTQRSAQGFLQIDVTSREKLVADLAQHSVAVRVAAPPLFFERFRFLTVVAYYTTPQGFLDIGYTGNVPLPSYPPVTDEERRLLEAELSKLGISDPQRSRGS